jgi:pilus assembly protein Flp/PilA
MRSSLDKMLHDDSGATAIEYALMAALIFLVIYSSVQTVGTRLSAVFDNAAGNL